MLIRTKQRCSGKRAYSGPGPKDLWNNVISSVNGYSSIIKCQMRAFIMQKCIILHKVFLCYNNYCCNIRMNITRIAIMMVVHYILRYRDVGATALSYMRYTRERACKRAGYRRCAWPTAPQVDASTAAVDANGNDDASWCMYICRFMNIYTRFRLLFLSSNHYRAWY